MWLRLSSTVTSCAPLAWTILLGAAEAGQQVGDGAVHQMAAIELGRDLHRELHRRPRRLDGALLGNGAQEIAAEADEGLHRAVDDALADLDGRHALLARRLEVEHLGDLVERHQLGLLGDAHRPLALHVGVAADRRDAGASRPMLPRKQQQVHEHGDVVEAARVLGQAHAVDPDHALGLGIDLRRLSRSLARSSPNSRTMSSHVGVAHEALEGLEAAGVVLDEIDVEHARPLGASRRVVEREHVLAHAGERRDVAAGLDLVILAGDLRRRARSASRRHAADR